jgi:hypothetical protein
MSDEKKPEPCAPVKKEVENCTDDRILLQVDDTIDWG